MESDSPVPLADETDPVGLPQIGAELQRLRKDAGLTLDVLSRLSGVSKSLLSQIERDQANPTYTTLWRVCIALKRTPDALFSRSGDDRDALERVSDRNTPVIWSEDGLCRLKILGSLDCANLVQWYLMNAEPGGTLRSSAHGAQSIEHLHVLSGTLEVKANGASETLGAHETARYATRSGNHVIINAGNQPASALMVCILTGPRPV